MVTHDPRAAAYADRVVFLADGRVVGELASPTADAVLEQMKKLGRLTMRKVTLSGLLARKLRLALTALAIVLGVTFVTGTLVLGDTLNRTFNNLIGTAYQHVSFEIRGKAALNEQRRRPPSTAPPTASRCRSRSPPRSAGCPGVAFVHGSVEGYAQFVDRDGNAIGSGGGSTLGFSFDPNPQLSPLPAGRGQRARRPPTTS